MSETNDKLAGVRRLEGVGATRRLRTIEEERREREVRLLLRIARGAFLLLIVVVTLLNIIQVSNNPTTAELEYTLGNYWLVPVFVALGLGLGVLAVDLLTPNKRISSFSAVVFGLLVGILAAFALGFTVDLVATSWEFSDAEMVGTLKVLAGICICYLSVTIVLQTQDDLRLVIPYVEFAKQVRGQRPLILDTSSLIDGRILGVVESGLVQAPMLIPRFVLEELQRLSDSADKLKRARGRRGLDLVSKLQRSARADVTIDETPIPGNAVDQMLIELGRQSTGVIVTTDSGLARVASIESVRVVNVHDVASAMRQSVVPGESIRVRLVKRGEQAGQAVGYLEDGTMVVAEDGEEAIGDEVELVVQTSLQTSGGRMIFARIGDEIGPIAGGEDAGDVGTEHLESDQRAESPDESADSPDRAINGAGTPGPTSGPRVVKRAGRNPRR